MRFDSPEHLEAWQATGKFPAIHDAITTMALNYLQASRIIDLGCSYGLLGARLAKMAGLYVVGIDSNATVLSAGEAAQLPVSYVRMRVDRPSLPDLFSLIQLHAITGIIARRILPELWGHDDAGGREFARTIAAAGVEELLIQGRAPTPDPATALPSVDAEIDLLSDTFQPIRRVGQCAYLRRR